MILIVAKNIAEQFHEETALPILKLLHLLSVAILTVVNYYLEKLN